MKKAALILLTVLINAAVTVLLIWQYDRRFAPKVYVVDVDAMARNLAREVTEGRMTPDDLKEKIAEISKKVEVAVGSSRAIVLRKEAVIGGAVEEIKAD